MAHILHDSQHFHVDHSVVHSILESDEQDVGLDPLRNDLALWLVSLWHHHCHTEHVYKG